MYSNINSKFSKFDVVKCTKKIHSNLVLMTDILLFENKTEVKLPQGTYLKLNENQEKFNYEEEKEDSNTLIDDSLFPAY